MGTVHYLAARTSDGGRMSAIQIDSNDPWATFRAMRKQMRQRRMASPHFAILEAEQRLGHQARIIDLSDRRAG